MEGVETMNETRAEELKNQGNEEFKKGNYQAAINYYSQALGMQKAITLKTKSIDDKNTYSSVALKY
jgi:hypothetical protein